MKFVNLKTCHGLETYLHWNGSLLRLSLLPELLRSMPVREASALYESIAMWNRPLATDLLELETCAR